MSSNSSSGLSFACIPVDSPRVPGRVVPRPTTSRRIAGACRGEAGRVVLGCQRDRRGVEGRSG
eukprot:1385318-Rhodomonas_salina.2